MLFSSSFSRPRIQSLSLLGSFCPLNSTFYPTCNTNNYCFDFSIRRSLLPSCCRTNWWHATPALFAQCHTRVFIVNPVQGFCSANVRGTLAFLPTIYSCGINTIDERTRTLSRGGYSCRKQSIHGRPLSAIRNYHVFTNVPF